MSVTEDQERKTEAPERALLDREIAIDAEVGDGRTLEMRVVPFDEIGVAADPPDFEPYKEQFMAGAFSKQERAANRILLTVDHLQGSVRTRQGVVQRVKAHLDKLTLTRRTPVYSKTAVLGLREGTEQLPDEQMVDEEFLPVDADPELIARCRALGIQLPQRYEAHPAETDPSAEHADTSEDGTRQTEEATTSED
jgi:hypothetical protein